MRVSEVFSLNRNQAHLDFVDVRLDTDIPLFIDPIAIKNLSTTWGRELSSTVQHFFNTVLKHIKAGNHDAAKNILSSLNERNEFHLGYSQGPSRGHAFGSVSAVSVWETLSKSKAARSGLLKDIEDTALIIPGIGKDMISDALCNILRGPLIKYTQNMCKYYGIPLTPEIPSGPVWNILTENWKQSLIPLPFSEEYGPVIFVPKLIVRQDYNFSSNSYYRHYILPVMQREHIQANSSLVKFLKDGSPKVTKKSLMEKYGADKLAVAEQTELHPNILKQYKDEVNLTPSSVCTETTLAELEGGNLPSITDLVDELVKIPAGRQYYSEYEDKVEKVLTHLFNPHLTFPMREVKIHNGRKRIDIQYTNEARSGFFAFLSQHYFCPLIHVECKNYGKEIGNPEIDQLAGRFSPNRGKVGILLCRSVADKKNLLERCKDTVHDNRGYIIVIDDSDLIQLAKEYTKDSIYRSFPLLKKKWDQLVS